MTHVELERQSRLIALALRERGVRENDRVAVHLATRTETVLVYLACLRLGAVIVPLDVRLAPGEITDLLDRTGPKFYFGELAHHGRLGVLPSELVDPSAHVLIRSDRRPGTIGFDDMVAGIDDETPLPDGPEGEHPAFVLATSGTSGRRKLVVWPHRTLDNLHLSAPGRGIDPGAVVPILTPLTHAAGIYFTFASLSVGATPMLRTSADGAGALDAMERHRATTVFGMPFMFADLAREQRARPRSMASLQSATVSGDVCPPLISQRFHEVFGVPLRTFWASTEEVGATVPSEGSVSQFRLAPGARARVVDQTGNPVSRGRTGQFEISSPTASSGSWPDFANRERHGAGWFRTGDLVREVGRDTFTYDGRVKDLIVRGGSNISPTAVEDVLRTHRDVTDVGVAGYPDDELGQRVGAALALRDSAGATIEDIVEWADARLAEHERPERAVRLDAIPRNALTKIDRAAITRHLVAAGGGDQVEPR